METAKKGTKRPVKQAGMHWLTPALTVLDVTKAMNFYEETFGFEKGMTMPDKDGNIIYGDMKYQGTVAVMLGHEGVNGAECKSPATTKTLCPVNLYVYCSDVDAFYEHAKRAGASIISQPIDMFWGDRIAGFEDIDGYRWTFATNAAEFDASKAPK